MANGGKRPGAGRPKGKKNAATLEREAVLSAFNQRVLHKADELFNAQFKLAVGSQKVFRIDEVKDGKGKVLKREHVWVTNAYEIKNLLDEHEGDAGEVDGSYYYFQAVMPDNRALDSLMNRTFGRPKETHELTGKDGGPVEVATRVIEPGE